MASLHSISVGQYEEFSRRMAQAGLKAEDVELILKHPLLARDMVTALRTSVHYAADVLRSPHQQLEMIRGFNAQYWQAFTSEEFAAAETKLDEVLNRISDSRGPSMQRLDNLFVVQVCFGSPYWDIVRWAQTIEQYDSRGWSVDLTEVSFDTPFHYERGFYLHRVNLLANAGRDPRETQGRLAQAEALAALALHPELIMEHHLLRGVVVGGVTIKPDNYKAGCLRIGTMHEIPSLALMHQEEDRPFNDFPLPTNLGGQRLI
jgi:hypothetical protein